LKRWRNYVFQLTNVHEVNEVRQTEIHSCEPSVPEPSSSEVETAIKKLKRYKLPDTGEIPDSNGDEHEDGCLLGCYTM
jgi:hypothetical protein